MSRGDICRVAIPAAPGHAQTGVKQSWCLRDPEGWLKALREWAESHPKRDIVIDDSRERIYAGRGE
jgi:hypothetical protein